MTGFYEATNGVEPVSAIPWGSYTHLVYFAATTDGLGNVVPNWGASSEPAQFIASRPPGKKALLSINDNNGNWNAFWGSTAPATIQTFATNIAAYLAANGYDGVDIDWEQNINASQYAQLFQQLRVAMPSGIITTDVNGTGGSLPAAAVAWPFIDQINIMCYDMDTPGNGFSWYNDALFQALNTAVTACDARTNQFLAANIPPAKIGIGMPFYGRRWTGVTQALVPGYFQAWAVPYNWLVTDPLRWQQPYQFYDNTYGAQYLSIASLDEFDTYTGAQQIGNITAWIHTMGFGGAMAYSLHYEYLPDLAGSAQYPLTTALFEALFPHPAPRIPIPRSPIPPAHPVRDRPSTVVP
jgi:chitinase